MHFWPKSSRQASLEIDEARIHEFLEASTKATTTPVYCNASLIWNIVHVPEPNISNLDTSPLVPIVYVDNLQSTLYLPKQHL